MFETINDATGFANGVKFASADDVNKYFTAVVQCEMFEEEAVTDQDQLDQWADWVIENHSHMENCNV